MKINHKAPNVLHFWISDYVITIFVFLVGAVFTSFVIYKVGSLSTFFNGFTEPLVFYAYSLWIKSIILDIKRIRKDTRFPGIFPGFVYWVYLLQWAILWMTKDSAYSSASKNSVVGITNSYFLSMYFSNTLLFWVIVDSISSVLLFPVEYYLLKSDSVEIYVLIDCIKYFIIFIIAGFLII